MFSFDPGALILCVVFLMQLSGVGGYFIARHRYGKREKQAAIRSSELRGMIEQAVNDAIAFSGNAGKQATALEQEKSEYLPGRDVARRTTPLV